MCIRSQYLTLVAIKKGCQLLSQQGNQPSAVNMDSSIRLIKEIDISDGMRLQKGRRAHKLKTHNKDSLLRAAQTLAGILQKQIVYDSTCARKDKAVQLFLYDKMDGYKDSHFYIRGGVTGSESAKAEFGSF